LRRAYRIVKRRHVKQAFTGEGAKLAGGRWNSPGKRAVYLSSTLSLAAIETFVHLGDDASRLHYVYFEIEIPDSVAIVSLTIRPRGWRWEPPSLASQHAGDRWLVTNRSALLEVPSAIIPTETNLVLNPAHPDAGKLRIGTPRPFQFDPRMWK
jgi:RES domain-containing protein